MPADQTTTTSTAAGSAAAADAPADQGSAAAGTPANKPNGHEGKDRAVAALADIANTPGVAKPDPILAATGVQRSFGGLIAVDVAELQVQRGAITALIGPNGAGKTTLFNLLTGFDKADSGTWKFNDNDISKLPSHKVARLGMVRTFQLTKALSKMTVLENMLLGAKDQRGELFWRGLFKRTWRAQETANTERAMELLGEFNLTEMAQEFGGSLSGGQRKLLEMARSLMVGPELIMLDEPMAGVNPALKQSLLDHIRGIREAGMTVLFVEHDMDMVRDVSDWVIVMGQGQVIAEGPPDAVMQQQAVIDAYLGVHHDTDLDEDLGEDAVAEAAVAEADRAGTDSSEPAAGKDGSDTSDAGGDR